MPCYVFSEACGVQTKGTVSVQRKSQEAVKRLPAIAMTNIAICNSMNLDMKGSPQKFEQNFTCLNCGLREMIDWDDVSIFPYFIVEAVHDSNTYVPYKFVVSLIDTTEFRSGYKGKATDLPLKMQVQQPFSSSSSPHPPMQWYYYHTKQDPDTNPQASGTYFVRRSLPNKEWLNWLISIIISHTLITSASATEISALGAGMAYAFLYMNSN